MSCKIILNVIGLCCFSLFAYLHSPLQEVTLWRQRRLASKLSSLPTWFHLLKWPSTLSQVSLLTSPWDNLPWLRPKLINTTTSKATVWSLCFQICLWFQVQVSNHDGSPAMDIPVKINLLDSPLLISGSSRVTVNMHKIHFPQTITVRRSQLELEWKMFTRQRWLMQFVNQCHSL